MVSKKETGFRFEREALNYLKRVFEKVVWVSKKQHQALIDFVAYDENGIRYLIEAKYNKKQTPKLSDSQQYYSDYVVYKVGEEGEIKLIKTKNFQNRVDLDKVCPFIDFERIEEARKRNWERGLKGRYRPVCNFKKDFIIYLDEIDVKDMGLEEGDLVDIDDLIMVKKEAKNRRQKTRK